MAYAPNTWADGSGGATPIIAAKLNNIEGGLATADANATTALGYLGQDLALTGATAPTRYVGGVSGAAPTTGTFTLGDFVVDSNLGALWVCVASGSPGTWKEVSGFTYGVVGNITNSAPGDSAAAGTNAALARVDHLHGREGVFTVSNHVGKLSSTYTLTSSTTTIFNTASLATGTWLVTFTATLNNSSTGTSTVTIGAGVTSGTVSFTGPSSTLTTLAGMSYDNVSLTLIATVSSGSATLNLSGQGGSISVASNTFAQTGYTAIQLA